MSAFEKLPREIRDLIYELCLVHEGEIIPFPRDYERGAMERLLKMPGREDGQDPFMGYPNGKRDSRQTKKGPCVALLGVNSTIREEAAIILFGKNVWRLSSMPYVQDDRYRLWMTHAKYFRHVVTSFHARNLDRMALLDIEMMESYRSDEVFEIEFFDQTGSLNQHHHEVSLLRDDFIAKRDILQQMKLKSLSLDFSCLNCYHSCCRYQALLNCLVYMGSIGPWYRLEREQSRGLETEGETDIKVHGLNDLTEKQAIWEIWGLKVD